MLLAVTAALPSLGAATFEISLGPPAEPSEASAPEDDQYLASISMNPSSEPTDDGGSCAIEKGVRRLGAGATYNDASRLIVYTPGECCAICMADPKCKSWDCDLRTGACALKATVPEATKAASHFSSGVIGGSSAPDQVPAAAPCPVEEGVFFPGKELDVGGRDMTTETAEECCRLCQADLRCFSWVRSVVTGRCSLKDRIPPRERREEVQGGTVL